MHEYLEMSTEEDIWTVRLNRPAERNVLSVGMMQALTAAAHRLQDEPAARAVILAANGPNFTAGADLKDAKRWGVDKASLAAQRAAPKIGERMCQAWEDIPAMTVCAVEGYCIGGGTALAICTDFRVVAASAYFRLPEVALGIPLSWGALPRLVRMLGPSRAKRAIALCETFTGRDAVDFGLADFHAGDGQAYAAALDLARRIALLPDVAVKMTKEAVNVTAHALNRLASFMAHDQVALAAQSAEAVAARSAFAAAKKRRS